MANEQYSIPQSKKLVELFDKASNQVGLSRGQVFEDFLIVTKCSLAGGTMEDEYFSVLEKGYNKGQPGKRGIDTLKDAFHKLIDAMEATGQDVLGDVFTGAVSYGERGQFFTPDSVCDLIGALSVPTERTEAPKTLNDPACGSGRMLLSVARHQPHWEFTGQDVDHRAAQMTAMNLGLNGLYGWAVWQNTLTLECHRVYKIGMHLRGPRPGVIQDVPVEQTPFNFREVSNYQASQIDEAKTPEAKPTERTSTAPRQDPPEDDGGCQQLDLF